MPYPRAFSHVGLSVTDIEEAVEFYTEVLGCYLIVEPASFDEEEDADRPVGQMLTDALGAGWNRVKIAHLATSDGIGIELFEFEGAERSEDPLQYRQTGIFHFCVQDPDIEGLAQKIEEHGGKQTMPVRAYHPGEKPFKMVYCEDPFGNVIEIYTHSYEMTYSVEAYEREAAE